MFAWLHRPLPPFPDAWRALVAEHVPLAARLPAEDREKLERLVQEFLTEKSVEGAGGLVVTDTIRVAIAAQACLLVLHREGRLYPGLRTIIVYPKGWVAPIRRAQEGVVLESSQARSGESWHNGPVVLSWADVRRGALAEVGHNVVIHEFAHQLDTADGPADGAPSLERSQYRDWARVLGHAFTELVEDVHRDRPTDLDPYGATSPAEFFATVTERFFERPRDLRAAHPELYSQLAGFYRQDPAEWAGRGDPPDP
jgi:hypothetical protein